MKKESVSVNNYGGYDDYDDYNDDYNDYDDYSEPDSSLLNSTANNQAEEQNTESLLQDETEEVSDQDINILMSGSIDFKNNELFTGPVASGDDPLIRQMYHQAEHLLLKSKNHCFFSLEEYQRLYQIYKGDDPYKATIAGNELVLSVFKMILNIAIKKYSTYFRGHKMELIQHGNMGVTEALQTYNGSTKFSTWCYPNIIHYMNEYVSLITHNTTMHYSAHIRKIQESINNKRKRNLPVSLEDIAIEEGIPLSTLIKCEKIMNRNQNSVSFDNPESKLTETVPDRILGPEATLLQKERHNDILSSLDILTETERKIIDLSMGFTEDGEDNGVHLSEKEISTVTGVKISYVKLVKEIALCKMKRFMDDRNLFQEDRSDRSRQSISSLFENAFPTAALQRQLQQIEMQRKSNTVPMDVAKNIG